MGALAGEVSTVRPGISLGRLDLEGRGMMRQMMECLIDGRGEGCSVP